MQPKLPLYVLPLLRISRWERSFVTASAVFLALHMAVRADQITYNIVNYPAAEKDVLAGHVGNQDSISGTITAISSGTLAGTYSAGTPSAMTVTLDVSMTISSAPGSGQPSFTFTDDDILSNLLGSGSATFNSSALLLNNGFLEASMSNPGPNSESGSMEWRSDEGLFSGTVDVTVDNFNEGPQTQFGDGNGLTEIGPSPWTVATAVPEPSVLGLLGVPALLAFGRRRFRKASR
jgi:hypothetical protein